MEVAARLSAIGIRAEVDPLAPLFMQINAVKAANPDFISLAVGAPDNELLSVDMARRLFDVALERYGAAALNYTKPDGMPPFVSAYLARAAQRGVKFDPNTQQLLVTSGGMEAISMASEMLLDPGDTVLVEEPAFPGAMSVFKLWGAKVVHVHGDELGMSPEALSAKIKVHKPKLVLLMPDGQNPSGKTMPLERRTAIAALLDEHGVYAIEDAAYSQLSYSDEELPPLQALSERVLYADSMSKIMYPASRLGVLIASKEIISEAANLKSAYNMQASAWWQCVAERYLDPEAGFMQEFLPGLVQEYARRRDAMVAAVREHFPEEQGYHFIEPQGGMFLWLEGPDDVDFDLLVQKAIAKGVAYAPGNYFYEDGVQGKNAARLNFASAPVDRIDEAVRRIAETVAGN